MPPRQRLEFRYDGLGRLIGKKVYSYSGGWVLDLERRFVYDGWQMIAELGVNGPTLTWLRTYARGLDLTGTLHGAGGVGGLNFLQRLQSHLGLQRRTMLASFLGHVGQFLLGL